jgi:uncharacterized protein YhaN
VLECFELIRQCEEALRTLEHVREEADTVAAQIHAWEERARQALNAAGSPAGFADERLIQELLTLRRRCQSDRDTRDALDALDRDIEEREACLAKARMALQNSLDTRAGILASVGAADEAGFQASLAIYRRRQVLHAREQDLERQIAGRIGRGVEADGLRDVLSTGKVGEWRRQIEAAELGEQELQQRRDEAVARHRDAERARAALEASSDVASLDNEIKGLEAELSAAVREWRVVTLARSLIDETLREFERTRQPAVLADASRSFADVTNGRYIRVVQEENGQDLAVIDSQGGRRTAEALSRGTAEQLYLCIRLALAAEFGRRSEPLPLIMDDVLVNFDPARAEAVARVIASFARDHQVLLFTCHPSTRDMLRTAEPRAKVIELDPAGLSVSTARNDVGKAEEAGIS